VVRRKTREEIRSTQGTSRVREKPRVDTLNVKGMAAFRQESKFILCFKLTETNRTIKRRDFETDNGLVMKNR
jgi:hypothetical protein